MIVLIADVIIRKNFAIETGGDGVVMVVDLSMLQRSSKKSVCAKSSVNVNKTKREKNCSNLSPSP